MAMLITIAIIIMKLEIIIIDDTCFKIKIFKLNKKKLFFYKIL